MSSIFSNSFLTFAFKLLSAALALLISILSARYFGIEILGKYNFVITVISILVIFCSIGTDQVIVRYLSRNSRHCQTFNNSVLFSSFLIRMSLCLLVFFGLYGGGFVASELYSNEELLLFSIILVFCLFNSLFQYALQGLHRSAYSVLTVELSPNIIKLLGILMIINVLVESSFITILRVHAITLITGGMFSFIVYISFNHIAKIRLNAVILRRLLVDGTPLLITSSTWLVMLYSDIIVLGIISGDTEVGGYSVVQRVATLITILLSSVNAVIAPRVSNYYHSGQDDRLQRLIKLSTFFLTISGFSFLVIASIFSEDILAFWGEDFIQFSPVLIILLCGQFVNAATGSVGTVLVMTGRHLIMRNVAIFASVINVILNVGLIYLFGTVGAAIATAISLSLLNIL